MDTGSVLFGVSLDMGAVQQNLVGASSESLLAAAMPCWLNLEKKTGDPLAQIASYNSTPEEGQAFGPTSLGGMLVGLLANLVIRPAARSEAVRPFPVSRNLAFDFILMP